MEQETSAVLGRTRGHIQLRRAACCRCYRWALVPLGGPRLMLSLGIPSSKARMGPRHLKEGSGIFSVPAAPLEHPFTLAVVDLSVQTTVPGIYGSSSATRSSCLYLPGSEQAVALAPSWRAWLEVGKVGKGAGTRPLLMPACCPQALRAKASSPRSRGPQR